MPLTTEARQNEVIAKLVKLWYETISGLHHKDRDCHFHISKHWRYDGELVYNVEHDGYLLDFINIECKSYAEAQDKLIALLVKGIKGWSDVEDSTLTPERRAQILSELPS